MGATSVYLSRLGSARSGPVAAAVGVGLSWPIFAFGRLIVETTLDPTSNNLWPLGIFFSFALSVSPAVVGLIAAWSDRRDETT